MFFTIDWGRADDGESLVPPVDYEQIKNFPGYGFKRARFFSSTCIGYVPTRAGPVAWGHRRSNRVHKRAQSLQKDLFGDRAKANNILINVFPTSTIGDYDKATEVVAEEEETDGEQFESDHG